MHKHVIFIGPRGAGKGMLVSATMQAYPQFKRIVSHTTRSRRPGERDGDQYRFVTPCEFEDLIARGEFIGWQKIGSTQLSGVTRKAALAEPFGVTDVTGHVAGSLCEFTQQQGGKILRIGVWAPRHERWYRAKRRQPELTDEQVDELMISDPNPQELESYAVLDHLVVNDHPTDPGPAVLDAIKAVRKFLNGS